MIHNLSNLMRAAPPAARGELSYTGAMGCPCGGRDTVLGSRVRAPHGEQGRPACEKPLTVSRGALARIKQMQLVGHLVRHVF